jgi:hypothetical protein
MTDRDVFGAGVVPVNEFPEAGVDTEAEVIAILEEVGTLDSDEAKTRLRIGYPAMARAEFLPQAPGDREYTYYLGLYPQDQTTPGYLSVVLFKRSDIGMNLDELAQRMRWFTDKERAILLRTGGLRITPNAVSDFGNGLERNTDLAMRDLLTVNFPGRQISVPRE